MPVYEYKNTKTGDVFQIKQSIKEDSFKKMKDIFDYAEDKGEDCDFMFVGNDDILESESMDESSYEEDTDIERLLFLTPVHFIGMGWPSANAKAFRYQGKHKKLCGDLREERAKRRSRKLSLTDAASQIGISGITEDRHGMEKKWAATDPVIPDAHWNSLPKEKQTLARQHGFRPSRDWSK